MSAETKYDADYFIRKFEAIPEEKWCERAYKNHDQCCALGHCGESPNGTTTESTSLFDLFIDNDIDVTDVNDAYQSSPYVGGTPRDRILAALRDIKAKEAK